MTPEITPEYLASQGLSQTFPQRFWAKVDKSPHPNGCWLWTGSVRWFKNEREAHGQIWRGVRNNRRTWTGLIYSHAASWILHYGPIPDGNQVQHKCPIKHQPRCCNPEHLKLGTPKDNSQDKNWNGTNNGANTPLSGEDSPSSKLKWEEVLEIRQKYKTGKYTQTQLAREYQITQTCIWRIVHNLSWSKRDSKS